MLTCGIAAAAVALPAHMVIVLSVGVAALVLLLYAGIALPAVWSAKPERRKAATEVLRQLLNAWGRSKRR
jgi:hypothetical protein